MNSFGKHFRVSIFGESHGPQLGVVLDGVPAGIPLTEEDFAADIARRAPGATGTTPRKESDIPHLLSGVFEGHTSGAPLAIVFDNGNTRSADYSQFQAIPRPGHADFTAALKFDGYNDPRGSGHFSGRLTVGIVAAGVVAKKILSDCFPDFSVKARLVSVGGCSDSHRWAELIAQTQMEGDSLGGVVECTLSGLPAGLGEPFWDSVEALVSHAVFSIPGVRGIEFGDGFAAASMKGSEHNDPFGADGPLKNGSGGVNGGITNSAPVVFRVAFKPTSSISKPQTTFNYESSQPETLVVKGRHDACFCQRCPVIVEAMAAIVFADLI